MTDIVLQTVARKPAYCLNTYLFGDNQDDPVRIEEIKRSFKFIEASQAFFSNVIFQIFIPEIFKNYVPGFYHLNKKYKENSDWLNETMLNFISKRKNEINNMQSDEKTGNIFCYTIWLLAKHPKVLTHFQKEISEILGDNISREIIYEDLEKFAYLDAIVKESAQIFTFVPLTPRVSTQESIIGGNHLEANTNFFVGHEIIRKLPEFWENPDEFIPERFLNNEIAKHFFIPFGGGMRICPGKNMSNVELKTLLILLFRKYDVELVDKVSEKPNIKYSFFYQCLDMKVIVRPRC
ncbi:cytochrome P450 [Rhizophagus irregularis]|uniref:Cytochrome P450 n=1 Tax=Rhizophagus irregularis TaxID=588596 RepID=A0A2N1N9D5_9GLOM|nr:cytochrome P450 [Rhizophagus irregularis]